jgi:hypothetical protein
MTLFANIPLSWFHFSKKLKYYEFINEDTNEGQGRDSH